jgi:hypothetical protein
VQINGYTAAVLAKLPEVVFSSLSALNLDYR